MNRMNRMNHMVRNQFFFPDSFAIKALRSGLGARELRCCVKCTKRNIATRPWPTESQSHSSDWLIGSFSLHNLAQSGTLHHFSKCTTFPERSGEGSGSAWLFDSGTMWHPSVPCSTLFNRSSVSSTEINRDQPR